MIVTLLVLAVFAYAAGSPDPAARAGRKGARVGVASGRLAGSQAWVRTAPRRAARSAQAGTWLRRTWLGRRVLDTVRVLEGVGAAFWWTCGAVGDVAQVAGSAVAGGVRAVGPGARDAWRASRPGMPAGQVPGTPGRPRMRTRPVPHAGGGGQVPPPSGQVPATPPATPSGQASGQPNGQVPPPSTGSPPHLTVVPDLPAAGTLPGPPPPPSTGSPDGQPATTEPGSPPGSPDTPENTTTATPNGQEPNVMSQASHTLVTEWTNTDDAIRDAATIKRMIVDHIDAIAELAAHSAKMPERMRSAPFNPGPDAEAKVHALVDATPDAKVLENWADAASFVEDALQAVKATVGEQVDSKGVSGEAKAFASA